MKLLKNVKTKYGVFSEELNADDIKFLKMTDADFDERANRLAYKQLNGIIDDEVKEADERFYRNAELMFGRKAANKLRKAMDKLFN
jgi:hypothetical protein